MGISNSRPYIALIPIITGSVSTISSSLIIYLIFLSKSKLSTIYHRILFGMSCADIIGSITMALSTLPMPEINVCTDNGDYEWDAVRIGNIQTCQAQGFFQRFGLTTMYTYNLILCFYYTCVIVFGMRENQIRKRLEPFFHIIPILTGVAHAIIPLLFNLYQANGIMPWCTVLNTRTSPNKCPLLRQQQEEVLSSIILRIPVLLFSFFFFIVIVCFGLIIWKTTRIDREISRYTQQQAHIYEDDASDQIITTNQYNGEDVENDNENGNRISSIRSNNDNNVNNNLSNNISSSSNNNNNISNNISNNIRNSNSNNKSNSSNTKSSNNNKNLVTTTLSHEQYNSVTSNNNDDHADNHDDSINNNAINDITIISRDQEDHNTTSSARGPRARSDETHNFLHVVERHHPTTKIIVKQAAAYIVSFIITLFFPEMSGLIGSMTAQQTWLVYAIVIFLPLQGFWNFLIFVGHKIYNYKRVHNDENETFFKILCKLFCDPVTQDPILFTRISLVRVDNLNVEVSINDEHNNEEFTSYSMLSRGRNHDPLGLHRLGTIGRVNTAGVSINRPFRNHSSGGRSGDSGDHDMADNKSRKHLYGFEENSGDHHQEHYDHDSAGEDVMIDNDSRFNLSGFDSSLNDESKNDTTSSRARLSSTSQGSKK